jgi:hypothetical protein
MMSKIITPSGRQGGRGNSDRSGRGGRGLSPPLFTTNKNKINDSTTSIPTAPNKEVNTIPPVITSPYPAAENSPATDTTTPDAMADDDLSDDVTVATRGSGSPRSIPTPDRLTVRDVTLKYLFQSAQEQSKTEAARQFLQLLYAITQIQLPTPNTVLDKNSKTIKNYSQAAESDFESVLPINIIPANSNWKKPFTYWTAFTVRTTMTVSEIRNHELVATVLHRIKGRLSVYPWPVTESEVVSIGFIVGAIPQYQMSDQFSAHLRTTISQVCKTKRVPTFKCMLSRISATFKGHAISCEAFDIQVRRSDVTSFVKLVCKAFPAQNAQSIMLYNDRYSNPDRFSTAVYLQAKHQDNHRIVAVKGISESDMFSFDRILHREFPDIQEIFPTNTTTVRNIANQPVGRWNIVCKRTVFEKLARDMHERLPTLFAAYLQSTEKELPEGAEPVTVVSRFKGKPSSDGDSAAPTRDSGKESYNSSWTARLVDFHAEADIPAEVLTSFTSPPTQSNPIMTSAPARTWAQIATAGQNFPQQNPPFVSPAPPLAPNPQAVPSPSAIQSLTQQLEVQRKEMEEQRMHLEAQLAAQRQLLETQMEAQRQIDQQRMERDKRMEAMIEAQHQQISQLTILLEQKPTTDSSQSPYRKRAKSESDSFPRKSSSSPRPDDASDTEETLGEAMDHDST